MNLKISSLLIRCKKDNVYIPFSNRISFIYGNAGVGKSTLVNLVSYALGNNIIKTMVVQQEIESVSLSVVINGELLVIDRKMNSNILCVKTKNDEMYLVAKKKNPMQTSFSDYLYSLENITPIAMLRGKSSKEISVSFSNYMWFSYLRQEELDNTLFYLGDDRATFKELASTYVLKTILEEQEIAETEINKEINRMKESLGDVTEKLSITKEILSRTQLSEINISHEIAKKSKEVVRIRDEIARTLDKSKKDDTLQKNIDFIEDILEKERMLGRYEAEIMYLREFLKIQELKTIYLSDIQKYKHRINQFETLKGESSNQQFIQNLRVLESIFFHCLLDVKFSYIEESDHVVIDKKTLAPSVYTRNNSFKFDYFNLSSGGKKTIYKICYALAIHIFAATKSSSSLLPQFVIVDTPMKNMSEREDSELYERLYCYFNNLFSDKGLLCDAQLIIIDKEIPDVFQNTNVLCKHLTNDKPLIPYLIK